MAQTNSDVITFGSVILDAKVFKKPKYIKKHIPELNKFINIQKVGHNKLAAIMFDNVINRYLINDFNERPYVIQVKSRYWMLISTCVFAKSEGDAVDRILQAIYIAKKKAEETEIRSSVDSRLTNIINTINEHGINVGLFDKKYAKKVDWSNDEYLIF